MKEIFKDAKVNDRVWSMLHGWGTIIEVNKSFYYSIRVKFDEDNFIHVFDIDGKIDHNSKPVLFWQEFKVPEYAYKKSSTNLEKNGTFKDIEVGDKVWCYFSGWGVVINIIDSNKYSIIVRFDKNKTYSFDINGKIDSDDKYPSLFWNEFKIPQSAYKNLKIDDKIIVYNNRSKKYKRHFAGWNEKGNVTAWNDGCTSWTANKKISWSNWELSDEDEE